MRVRLYEADWPVGESARPLVYHLPEGQLPDVIRWKDRVFLLVELGKPHYREAASTTTIGRHVTLERDTLP